MGNTCGCVRAQKEECAVDPAKAPLGCSPYPRSKLYLKRKKKKNEELLFAQESAKLRDAEESREIAARIPAQGRTSEEDFSNEVVPHKVDNGKHCSDDTTEGICPGPIGERSYLTSALTDRLGDVGESSSLSISGSCVLYQSEGDVESDGASRECVANGSELSRAKKQRKKKRSLRRSGVQDDPFDRRCLDLENKKAVSLSTIAWPISDIHVTGESEDMSAKEKLLLWSQQTSEGYAGVRCENFTSCWRDGRLFNAIIHKYRPDLVDMSQVAVQSNVGNLEKAFGVAEKLGVTRLLDPEDINVPSPDEKSVITYVSSLYDVFPKVPEGGEGINANDVDVKWIEYQNMVNYLIQWIKHHVTVMSDRSYSNNPAELKALYNQYVQFKDTEIPPKEKDKAKIKQLYKLLEVWIEFGRIKLPQGYHPNDMEKEWGKLIIAMLEREKSLRPEVERLEKLQQIASRLQCDSVACEDKLLRARNSLQLDVQRLESGLQFQNEQEVEGYLLESENLIRQQIVDAQILFDGKYYQADQLVQRVSKLRDELMFLKSDYSSVYSKGRSLSMEQTQLMIAGLNQSLNQSFSSGFSPSLTPSLTSSLSRSLTPSLTHGLTPVHTPSLSMALSSGLKPVLTHGFIQGFVPCMDTDKILTVKLMQIRKPLIRSQIIDPTLTEEEINTNFLQDLLNWVEDVQVQLARAEWGSDLPSIDSHLENHKNVHRAIEDFETSIREARAAEGQMTPPLWESYSEKLSALESQYIKLLATSRDRASHLDNLQNFVTRATNELIWLNEKEEEEVAYDWSDRNSSMLRKKEYHAELMQQLEDKDIVMRSVQDMADQLLLSRHPARPTIEAFKAAMQTQWSWILQLCYCVEKHLKENTAYFEFYNDAKESMDYLKNLQETIKRKYNCDKSSNLVRLEDLVQDSMDEKEQLLQYRSNIVGLMSRAKTIVQLKPRNPENPTRISIPIKAICDYKQIEITIYKDDECVLENNSHRAKWKVISPTGNEAMVPSVCFSVPPPNKEAIEMASRIEQLYQNVLALWHQSHINMKSVVSWHYLMNEISTIRGWNVSSIKTMLPGEHQQVLSSLQVHLKDFLEVSQESEVFLVNDGNQLDREVKFCKQYYEDLLKSAEREEQEESACNRFISEVRNIRLRVENCEKRLIRQIRTPMERDDLQESVQKISQQEKLKRELEELITDLEKVTAKCDKFFGQASSSSAPTLRTELNVVLQNLNQVYSLSSIYLDKLKTVNLIVKNSQDAEALVKQYETRLGEEDAVPPDTEAIQSLQNLLKQWRTEVDERRVVFHSLEDELQKGKAVSERMLRAHNERDMDMDWHKEKAVQLAERWENIHSQIDNRLHELESISISLNWYRDCYKDLDQWIQEMEAMQQKMQERQPEDILADELNQQKVLASQVEMKQGRMDECQKYSDEYSSAVKEYELQLMTYKAMVDSQQKSPVKRRRMQSSSDAIVQEFMDLRTRYTALVTLMTQYVKFASDALKRSEEEGTSAEGVKDCLVNDAPEVAQARGWIEATMGEGGRTNLKMGAGSLQTQGERGEARCLSNEATEKVDNTTKQVMAAQKWFLYDRRPKDWERECVSKLEPRTGRVLFPNAYFANEVVHAEEGERAGRDEEKSHGEEEKRVRPFVPVGAARFLAQREAEKFEDQMQSHMLTCHGTVIVRKAAGEEIDASCSKVQGSRAMDVGQLTTENLGNPEDITNSCPGQNSVLEHRTPVEDQSANLMGEPRHKTKGTASAQEVTLPQTEYTKQKEPTRQMQRNEIERQFVDRPGDDTAEHLLDFDPIIKPGKCPEKGQTSFIQAAVDEGSEVQEEEILHMRALADGLKRDKAAVGEASSALRGILHARKERPCDNRKVKLDGAAQQGERQSERLQGCIEEGLQHMDELLVNKRPTLEEKYLSTNPAELEFYSPPVNKSIYLGKSGQLAFEQGSEQGVTVGKQRRVEEMAGGNMVMGVVNQISLKRITTTIGDKESISLTPGAQSKYDALKITDQTDFSSKPVGLEPPPRNELPEGNHVDRPILFDTIDTFKRVNIYEDCNEELGDACDEIAQVGSTWKEIPEQVEPMKETSFTAKPRGAHFTEDKPDVFAAVSCCGLEFAEMLLEPDDESSGELEESAGGSLKIEKFKNNESERPKSSNSISQATIEMVPNYQSVGSEGSQWAVKGSEFSVELAREYPIQLREEHFPTAEPSNQDCTADTQERSATLQRIYQGRNLWIEKEKWQEGLADSVMCELGKIGKAKMTPAVATHGNGIAIQPGRNTGGKVTEVDSDRPDRPSQTETRPVGYLQQQLSASADPAHLFINQQSPRMQGAPDGMDSKQTIGFQTNHPRNPDAPVESSIEVDRCWEVDGNAQVELVRVPKLLEWQKMEECCEVENRWECGSGTNVKDGGFPRRAEKRRRFPGASTDIVCPHQQQSLIIAVNENLSLIQKVDDLKGELGLAVEKKLLLEQAMAHLQSDLEEERRLREAMGSRNNSDLEVSQYKVRLEEMSRTKARLEQELERLKLAIYRSELHFPVRGIKDDPMKRWQSEGHLPGQEDQNAPSEQTGVAKVVGWIDFDLETVEQVVRIKHIMDQMYAYIKEMQLAVRVRTAGHGTPADEAEFLRKSVTEFHLINDRTYKDLQSLLSETRSLEKNLDAAEHKASLRRTESSSLRLKLENAQAELKQAREEVEDYRQKLAHLERELRDSQYRNEDFRLTAQALSQDCASTQSRCQRLEEEIEALRQVSSLAEQQASTYKAAADNSKEQLEAAERRMSRGEKDWEQKTRELENKLANSQRISRELEDKVTELALACSRADDVASRLKVESNHLQNDKILAEERIEFQRRENNVLQETLKKVQETLEKKVNIEHFQQQAVRKVEDELAHHKQTATELNQKVEELKSAKQRADLIVISVKSELHSMKTERKVADQRGDAQRMQVDCLSEQLTNTQEQLIRKVSEVQEQELRAQQLQEEVDNGQQLKEQLKLQLAELMAAQQVDARSVGELQAELSAVKMEKGVLEGEVRMQRLQMQEFSVKLDLAQQHMRKDNHQHEHNWNIELGGRVEQSNHMAEDLIRQTRNCQYNMEWSEGKDQKRVVLEENYHLTAGARPMTSLIEVEFLAKEPCSRQSVLTTQHTAVQGKLTTVQKVPRLVETKYDAIRNKLLETRPLGLLEERKQTIRPLGTFKPPSEMAELGLGQPRGGAGKAFQEKETVLFGNGSLKNSAKHSGAKKTLGLSVDAWDAPAPRRDQGPEHKDQGDFVGAQLSKMRISSGTERFSQSTSVEHPSEASERRSIQNKNATFPTQIGDKYRTSSEQKAPGQIQGKSVPSAPILEFQGLRHQVPVRDLVEAELLNKNIAEQLEKGIQTVSQVQNSLGKYLNKINSIAGLYLEASKQKISFCAAVKEGIIESSVALGFLEAQAATGYIVHMQSGGKCTVLEAIESGLVPLEFKERLLQAEKGVTGYLHGAKTLSIFQAMDSKLLPRQTGGRLLEAQIATGGIIDPVRSVRLPLETACKQGLLNRDTVQSLYKVHGSTKGFQDPNRTARTMHYAELMRLCVVDLEGNYLLLPLGTRRISTPSPARACTISVVDTSTKSEVTLYDAFLKYYIERQTYLELSALQSQWRETVDESQYFLTDSNSGRQFSINDALSQGNISQTDLNKYRDGHITLTELADMLSRRATVAANLNSPVAGIWDPNVCRRISVLQAMRQNLVERLTATRLLEAQACTGGITDPATGKKYSISEALRRDLIDSEMAAGIQKSEQACRGFLQPGAPAAFPIAKALRENLLSPDLGHRFLELQYVTGGLVDPHLQQRISLEDALKTGLIDDQAAQRLKDEKTHARNLVCPKTKQKVTYKEALARAIFDCHTGLRLLEAAEHCHALG
ncbi:hypothetical protein scyTo_0004457 [Scyliorhinus torazame]|uniref:Dystonin n=1 Tax=Scyliorhinus torazame TaxID=75743 RepID=A0A401NRY7_SCYTO|nr:hypothetical protein [Scyliorhinus torazame]